MTDWTFWKGELSNPTPPDRRTDRPTDHRLISGYYRFESAKTKPSWPIVIWNRDGEDHTIFQIGGKKMDTTENAQEWADFLNGTWPKVHAVTKADWDRANDEAGFWSDGQPARHMDAAEKQGVDLTTGGNNPPLDQSLADQISALAESLDGLPEPKTKTEADVLSGMLDRMRLLLKKAEDERVIQKEPHLQAGREVDAKWKSIREPGVSAYDGAEARRKAFLKKFQKKLDEIAAMETARLRRVAEEEAARIAEETAKRLAEQAPHLSEAEIEEQAQAAAEQVAPVEEVQAARATSGSAFGRSSGLKKVVRGKITDMAKFMADPQVMNRDDVKELMQTLANRAAKGGFLIAGMEREEILE